MKKTWIFFKLRMLQLKSDKTALFFCYVLPVLLLLGIGYPLQLQSNPKIEVHYLDQVDNADSKRLLEQLSQQSLLTLAPYDASAGEAYAAVANNEIKRVLQILPAGVTPEADLHKQHIESFTTSSNSGSLALYLGKNDIDENRVENMALTGILEQMLTGKTQPTLGGYTLKSDRFTSYLVTLLPGLIGLTLMIIGFNGFGGVLIEEEHHGLFKNIKTITISPAPFLSGLFLSRLLVCYSVAVGLCLVAVFAFDIHFKFNLLLLALMVTLGSAAFLGIGLVIATVSPSTTSFSGIVNFVQMPFIVLGGVFFSVTAFPDWLQPLCMAIPLTQLNIGMQKVLFESMSLRDISQLSTQIAVLTAWCAASLAVAKWKFRW